MDWLGARLGYSKREDWYQIHASDFASSDGVALIKNYYNNSPYALVTATYPDYSYLPWLFSQAPVGIWNDTRVQRQYVQWLSALVGVGNNVRELRSMHFIRNHGVSLLSRYRYSVSEIIETLFPEDEVPRKDNAKEEKEVKEEEEKEVKEEEKKERKKPMYTPRHYWSDQTNQRRFLESLALKLGYGSDGYERFYRFSNKDLHSNGGSALLNRNNSSLYRLMQSVFPEFDFLPWKFKVTPRSSVNDLETLQKVFRCVENSLKFKSKEDWYRVSNAQLLELGVLQFFNRRGGVKEAVRLIHPEVAWDDKFFEKRSAEKKLTTADA